MRMVENSDSAASTSGTLGTGKDVDPEVLLKGVRQGLGLKWRRHRLDSLQTAITGKELVYHPLWLGKVLTFADRPPFPPKRTPNVVFIDAVSGYRGVLERVPAVDGGRQGVGTQVEAVITSRTRAERYVRAVLHTVNRGYVLKKPQHELVSLDMVWLPLWKVSLNVDRPRLVHVNGVTGEPESYMAQLWGSESWLALDEGALAPLRAPTQ